MSRVLNLTPHALHIYCGSATEPLIIPSDGDVRLKTAAVTSSLSHIHPLHYFRASDQVEAAIPIIHAQVFTGLDETSPGYKHLAALTIEDSIIVSMPVAQWMAKYMGRLIPCHILSPGTGPTSVVRFGDEQTDKKGQIKGVRALEYHEKPY
jgi:hypothetical protein